MSNIDFILHSSLMKLQMDYNLVKNAYSANFTKLNKLFRKYKKSYKLNTKLRQKYKIDQTHSKITESDLDLNVSLAFPNTNNPVSDTIYKINKLKQISESYSSKIEKVKYKIDILKKENKTCFKNKNKDKIKACLHKIKKEKYKNHKYKKIHLSITPNEITILNQYINSIISNLQYYNILQVIYLDQIIIPHNTSSSSSSCSSEDPNCSSTESPDTDEDQSSTESSTPASSYVTHGKSPIIQQVAQIGYSPLELMQRLISEIEIFATAGGGTNLIIFQPILNVLYNYGEDKLGFINLRLLESAITQAQTHYVGDPSLNAKVSMLREIIKKIKYLAHITGINPNSDQIIILLANAIYNNSEQYSIIKPTYKPTTNSTLLAGGKLNKYRRKLKKIINLLS